MRQFKLKKNPDSSSRSATDKQIEQPKPPEQQAPAPEAKKEIVDPTPKLQELGKRFARENDDKANKSGRHEAACQCSRCLKNRERRAKYAQVTGKPIPKAMSDADRIANEVLDRKVREWNKGLMKFVADTLKSEQPSGFEVELTEDGAVELFHMMSANVQAKFVVIAFLSGWGIFLTPRILKFLKDKKEEKKGHLCA